MKKEIFWVILLFLSVVAAKSQDGVFASWTFDEEAPRYSEVGKGYRLPGVKGMAYKFDGFSSYIDDHSRKELKMPGSFTIEAWVSLGAYPWNWAPILTIGKYKITGFYFGIDSRGRVGFQMSDATSVWHGASSDLTENGQLGMKLHTWYHVACSYSPATGIKVYINGELAGTYNDFEFKYGVRYSKLEEGFRLGMNREHLAPTDPVRDWATWPSQYSIDGIIDEVIMYNKVFSDNEIQSLYSSIIPQNDPEFASRDFPTVPDSKRFGAHYTRLEFYPEWDNIWPVGDHLDVVVQFDELPINLMFWRGTRYSACWVSENNKWMADQSRETGYNWFLNDGPREEMPTGCMEHMSDVQTRSSRVAVVESNDARVVVNWRYLQMDVKFRQMELSDNTLFGEWGNELYYIYPDGVAIRKVLPGRGGWQETILLNAPGTRPEDNVEIEACTLVNMDGESKSYSWENGYPKFDLKDANIQLINFKSDYKPFLIFREGGSFSVFNGEVRPEYSHFPWWNHWPVAQIASDGRGAYAPDRAAHSSLSWGNPNGTAAMYGMTNQSKEYLVDLAKSWNRPPELRLHSDGFESSGYDYTQRSYLIKCTGSTDELRLELNPADNSLILNTAFVIENWPDDKVAVEIGGKKLLPHEEFRHGFEYALDGSRSLILWLEYRSSESVILTIKTNK